MLPDGRGSDWRSAININHLSEGSALLHKGVRSTYFFSSKIISDRAAPAGTLQRARCGHQANKNGGATGYGKDARWKSPKADFPTSLGNPANRAGFPLSHSPDCCWFFNSNRTCHVLRKPDILTC